MDFYAQLQAVDTAKLFTIAMRLVSVETVQDVRAFAAKVQEASQIVVAAAMRIAGLDAPADTRALHTPAQSAQIETAIAAYQEAQA
jgi:hypothetical protein